MAFGTRLPFPLPRPFGSVGADTGGNLCVGSAAGVATVAGALTLTHNLAGSVSGASSASGLLFSSSDMEGTAAGTSSTSGTLTVVAALSGAPAGSSTVAGDLLYRYLYATVAGSATVSADPTRPPINAFEIPYNLSLGGQAITNLVTSPFAIRCYGRVNGELFITSSGTSAGVTTVTGTLYEGQLPSTTSAGSTTMTGWVFVSATAGVNYLAGTSAGVGTMIEKWFLTLSRPDADQDRFLYQYVSVGVGFDPTDDGSGLSGFVSQTYPDGDVDQWDRYLYEYVNVGVGFDDTDDASLKSGFVSQTYPDGNIVTDWDRYLYQYVNIWDPGFRCSKSLVFYPGWSPQKKPVPKPPRGSA